MRVQLPEGYVPPEPTHPRYGYLTPEELEAYEAEERSRLGIVPEAPAPGSEETEAAVEVEPPVSPWAPPPETPATAPPVAVAEPEATVEARPAAGWVPAAPPEPEVERTHRREPLAERTTPHEVATDPVVEELPAATEREYRWDAYRQKWVATSESPAGGGDAAAPPPDHAAAAGGRGSSSSWTSADGQRFRWDARTQKWIVEAAEPPA